jgi:NitT/TauT family transport system substrate-binding protein
LQIAETEYDSGEFAILAMLIGAVDVATCSEVPVVAASLRQTNFAVVATVAASSYGHTIVARKDAEIATFADLRGKRVATLRNTGMHFLLHLTLLHQKMSDRDVTLSFLKEHDVVGPLIRGEVDAIAVREPYTSLAAAALGDEAVVLEQPGMYLRTQHIVGNKEFLRTRPEAAQRLIRGLLRAEQFAQQQPEQARRIVARRLRIEPAKLARDWEHLQLKVSLEQRLLVQLEDEARWMLGTHLVPPTPMPNYLEFLDISALEAVKPQVVTVLH